MRALSAFCASRGRNHMGEGGGSDVSKCKRCAKGWGVYDYRFLVPLMDGAHVIPIE